jgi:hypothetical protein
MQIPTLKLKPPPRYGDLKELEAALPILIPMLMPQLAALAGKRTPKLTQRETKQFNGKLRKFLLAARPYLLGLETLKQGPDREKCSYALFEGLIKEQFRAFGTKIRDDQDGLEFLLKQAEQAVRSPKALVTKPAYSEAKRAVYEFVLSVCQHVPPQEINRRLEEWYASKSCKKYIHSCVIWPTLIGKSRQLSPVRLTLKLADQLSEEYRMGCSLMEERLTLLIWLDEIAQGSAKPWIKQEVRSLFDLLQAAAASSKLSWVNALINRSVRNALAHGQPELNFDTTECTFHDRSSTVTWKMNEFFERTKQLTLATRALMELQAIIQLVQTQQFAATLWQRAQI